MQEHEDKLMSIKKETFKLLDELTDDTIISGWQLADNIRLVTGRHPYPSTLLGYCREYCDYTGGRFECIDNQKSIYKYHKGAFTLNGNIPSGKE